MSEVRYGPVIGNYFAIEHPVAATQKFHPNGASFVYLDNVGHVTMAPSNHTCLFGWAMAPRSLKGTDLTSGYWTSGAIGISKLPVIVAAANLHVVFRVPLYAPTVTPAAQARCGEGCNVNTLVATTYMQTVDLSATSTNLALLVVGLPEDGDTNSILVCFSPLLVQTDGAGV